jgi:hypothetical protein
MTDSELIKLSPVDLASALNDKEVIAQLRKDSGLLSHVMEILSERELADTFVKNKFAPKEAVAKYPQAFIDSFIEHNFNPGLDGILDLCEMSNSQFMDRSISKLLSVFSTNKYDAAFIRAIMNLSSSKSGAIVSETLSVLMTTSGVTLILLNDLKETNPGGFLSVLTSLPGDLRTEGIKLLDKSFVSSLPNDNELYFMLFKFIYGFALKGYGDKAWSFIEHAQAYFNLLSDPAFAARINDDEAKFIIESTKLTNASGDYRAPYRKAYEEIYNETETVRHGRARVQESRYRKAFKGVPKDSKFFLDTFNSGGETLSAKEAYQLLNKPRISLGCALYSGSDQEMAEEIDLNPDLLEEYIKTMRVTPAALRDALGISRPLTARAVLKIVGSSHRVQILSNYKNQKTNTVQSPVGEKHSVLVGLIEQGKGSLFLEKFMSYDQEAKSLEGNFRAFLTRHAQKTYADKYERTTLSQKFLSSLKDEEIAMLMATSQIRIYRYGEGGKGFLSAKNAKILLDKSKSDASHLLEMTYEKPEFLNLLDQKELASLSTSYGRAGKTQESTILAADLLVKKAKKTPGSKPIEIGCDEIKKQAALLLSKKDFVSLFKINALSEYEMEFKGGEKFSAEDILLAAKTASYRIRDVIPALESIGAMAEVKKVCLAIVDKTAKKFSELFPSAGNRSSELKERAQQVLGELDPESVNVESIIKTNPSISGIRRKLGDKYIDFLLSHEPKDKPAIVLDSAEITKAKIRDLSEKYSLSVGSFSITGRSELNQLMIYSELGIPVQSVSLRSLDLREIKTEAATDVVKFLISHPEFNVLYGKNILKLAALDGCSSILRNQEIESLIPEVCSIEGLKLAHKLDLPISSLMEIAEVVGNDEKMLQYAIENHLRFNNFIVSVSSFQWEKISKLVRAAEEIGLTIVTEEEFKSLEIYNHVLEKNGDIKNFEPISLSSISMSDRVELIKLLSDKNPKYKKLLGQNLGSDDFILSPPNLLDKSILTVANLKDNLGFGAPGDLTKEEKDSLSDLVTARGPLLSVASSKLKEFLSLAELNDVKFDDIFHRDGSGKLIITNFAYFLATKYKTPGASVQTLFKTILKNPSKSELIATLSDKGSGWTNDFLRDSIASLDAVRTEINQFVSLIDDDIISAPLIFNAMSGDAGSNSVLEERMSLGDDNAEMIKSLSNAVKIVTVTVSIARKQSKAGEEIQLSKVLHDSLGDLVSAVFPILKNGGDLKKSKMRGGFEKFNENLLAAEKSITSNKSVKPHQIYFPQSLQEVREIGTIHDWCTKYNDSYFDDMISGDAVLFNIKEGQKIVAQGFAKRDEKSRGVGEWTMSQLRYPNNGSADRDFDNHQILLLIKELIGKDSKLSERYVR